MEITPQVLSFLERTDQLWCMLELHSIDVSKSMFTKPPEVQQLFNQFSSLFQPPSGLPPKRSSVHTILLVPGVQPFRLWPYRYNSAQKDEIEKQAQQLLENGWIQESQSP
jgi:hypothetical protein